MMIRYLDILKFIYDLWRAEYALTSESTPKLNVAYRFLVGLFGAIMAPWSDHASKRDKLYALAANDGSVISIEAYLNKYYGDYGTITVVQNQSFSTYMYPYGSDKPVTMYPYGEGAAFLMYNYGSLGNAPVIEVPSVIPDVDPDLYNEMVADINALVMYSVQYSIMLV